MEITKTLMSQVYNDARKTMDMGRNIWRKERKRNRNTV